MGAPKGYAWFNPGIPSLTVPYHDTYDFYYSGHIGSSFIYMCEFFIYQQNILGYIATFTLINEWILMILLRSHYFIDMLSGVIIGHVCVILAEKAAYILDVKWLGIRGVDRRYHYFTPCKKCGWSNLDSSKKVSKTELTFLTKTCRIRK